MDLTLNNSVNDSVDDSVSNAADLFNNFFGEYLPWAVIIGVLLALILLKELL